MQGWARAQAAHQEDGVRRKRSVLQEEEEGLLSRLSDSASRFRGPTGGGSGCVEGSRGQGDSGRGKTGERAEGPDATSGCLTEIQC